MYSQFLRHALVGMTVVLFIVLLGAQGALAQRWLVLEDQFTAPDNSPPDTTKWVYRSSSDINNTFIKSNMLRMQTFGKYKAIETVNGFQTSNFTILVEWKVETTSGLMFGLSVNSSDGGPDIAYVSLTYDNGRGWATNLLTGGKWANQDTYNTNVETDTWYSMNLTVTWNQVTFSVAEKATGTQKFSKTRTLDPFIGTNMARLQGLADAWFDNFYIYDYTVLPRPVWGPVPTLGAIEDEPVTYDFSGNVTDEDTPPSGIMLSSVSPYVKDVDGLNVTFLFPDGVLHPTIPLVASDGRLDAVALLQFDVEPVNDAPTHTIPLQHTAVEDVPYTIDLTTYIDDVDDAAEDLTVLTDSPYATVDGLELTVTFPEGVLGHVLWLNVSDGELSAQAELRFTVTPVDDPPSVAPLDPFAAVEDQVSVLDLTPYLSDVDTPLGSLSVACGDGNCTVAGRELRFLFTRGGFTTTVEVMVSDATSHVVALLEVQVEERNDPPVIGGISPWLFEEDRPETIDLGPYITDEDSPAEDLALHCEHPAVVSIDGLAMTLLYTMWQDEHTIEFTVTDGEVTSTGSILAQVREVNDAPRVVDVGGMTPPFDLTMQEGTERWLITTVVDEDSGEFVFTLTSDWSGIQVMENGTLHLVAAGSDVGEHGVKLTVRDPEWGLGSISFNVTVLNVNDPPDAVIITSPENHTVVEEGGNVTFSVQVSDPDTVHGQVLTVTWTSNVSGTLRTLTSEDNLTFVVNGLPPGLHRVTVTVSDGELSRSGWLEVQVNERYVPPEKPAPTDDGPDLGNLLVVLGVVAALVVVVTLVLVLRRGGSGPPQGTGEAQPWTGEAVAGDGMAEGAAVSPDSSHEDEYNALYGNDLEGR